MVESVERVTPKKLNEIIESREPRGLFMAKEYVEHIVAVDNTTGDAWTEFFPDVCSALNWLLNKGEVR